MTLINKYKPSIDIIVQGKRYRVLLWYNSHKSNYPNKPVIVRNYIQLFIIWVKEGSTKYLINTLANILQGKVTKIKYGVVKMERKQSLSSLDTKNSGRP